MSDDWRLRIELNEHGHAIGLTKRLEASELEHDLETSFQDRLVVSRDGPEVFCYAGTRQQAEQAEGLIRSLAAEHGWHLKSELKRWHPSEEKWEDPDTPLNTQAEHAALMEQERQEARQRGYPEFEVRVQCPSHAEAVQLAEKLRGEGLSPVRRSRYLLVGAVDEDSAKALADRLEREAPPGSTATVEGTGRAVRAEQPANPFAVLGGLGG